MSEQLPKAIRKQMEEAKAIEEQLNPSAAPPDTGANTEPVPEAEPVAKQDEPEPAREENSPPAATQEPTHDTWEAKFRVLQGKYGAEVPRLHESVTKLAEEKAALEARLKALEQAKQEPEKPREPLITSADEDTFGKDLVEFVRRAVTDGTQDSVNNLLNKVGKLEQAIAKVLELNEKVGRVEKKVVESEEQKFWANVDALVPDWESVDADPRWIAFLETTPKFSSRTYRALATEAISVNDHVAIKGLVDEWKELEGITAAQEKASSKTKELERQLTPDKKSTATNPTPTKKVWTFDEYNDAFDPRKLKDLSQAEIIAVQAEADLALLEGRVKF